MKRLTRKHFSAIALLAVLFGVLVLMWIIYTQREVVYDQSVVIRLHDGSPAAIRHTTTRQRLWLDLGHSLSVGGGDIKSELRVEIDGKEIIFPELELEPAVLGRLDGGGFFLATQEAHITSNVGVERYYRYAAVVTSNGEVGREVSYESLPRHLLVQNIWTGLWQSEGDPVEGQIWLEKLLNDDPEMRSRLSETKRIWLSIECPQNLGDPECVPRYKKNTSTRIG